MRALTCEETDAHGNGQRPQEAVTAPPTSKQTEPKAQSPVPKASAPRKMPTSNKNLPLIPAAPLAAAETAPPSVEASPPLDSEESVRERLHRGALDRTLLKDPAAMDRIRKEAAVLKDVAFQGSMVEAAGLDDSLTSLGARLHLLQFRAAAGSPKDPVEQLLLDMLALARVRVGRIHALAECSKSPELTRAYLSAGNRMMSEICKTVLTLVAYRESTGRAPCDQEKADTELVSNRTGEPDERDTESSAGSGRPTEPKAPRSAD